MIRNKAYRMEGYIIVGKKDELLRYEVYTKEERARKELIEVEKEYTGASIVLVDIE